MKFYKRLRRRKIKRYRKINMCEYAILFDNSNSLIDFICNLKSSNIISSSLYLDYGYYQLLIVADTAQNLSKSKNIIFKDKLHIDEIKFKSRLICKDNAVLKFQKAFKDS